MQYWRQQLNSFLSDFTTGNKVAVSFLAFLLMINIIMNSPPRAPCQAPRSFWVLLLFVSSPAWVCLFG